MFKGLGLGGSSSYISHRTGKKWNYDGSCALLLGFCTAYVKSLISRLPCHRKQRPEHEEVVKNSSLSHGCGAGI